MKKLLSLALIAMVCCSAALMFGCSSKNGSIVINGNAAVSVTISQSTIDDEMAYMDAYDAELVKITLEVKDEAGAELFKGTLYDAKLQGANVTGFSLKTAGTRTAKVSMHGVTGEFTYTVTVS